MQTIAKIFMRDLKRLAKNPVAIIITIGVALIPSLYAWFNIAANWDPYENTSTVPVAIVNEDTGAEVGSLGSINAGDMIVNELHKNNQLAWTFVDKDEAQEGVQAGRYYAAFVIPSNFTSSLSDVLDGDTTKADIDYYVNEKVNAISPKVTDTGASTLESQISERFIATATSTITNKVTSKASDALNSATDSVESAITSVHTAQSGLDTLSSNLHTSVQTIESSREAVAQARTTLSDISGASKDLSESLGSSLDQLSQTRKQAGSLAAQLSAAVGLSSSKIAELSTNASYDVAQATAALGSATGKIDAHLNSAAAVVDNVDQLRQAIADQRHALEDALSLISFGPLHDKLSEAIDKLDQLDAHLASVNSDASSTINKLLAASEGIASEAEATNNVASSVATAANSGSHTLNQLNSDLLQTSVPQIGNALDGMAQTGTKLEDLTASLPAALAQTDALLGELDTTLAQAADTLNTSADKLGQTSDSLTHLADDIAQIQSTQIFETLRSAMNLNAQSVGDFMGSPAQLVEQDIFPVANYGSGVAPFYTNLALWVGGFVLVAIYKLEVDKEEIGDYKPWQGYFGRGALLVCIGLLQALICTIGDLVMGIQCVNPAAFIFAGLLESFVYVNFVYALSVAFKHIGKALGVLLVVLQIPGSAGTYPIEMMPGFFRALYPWLPFTYGINAMRESIAGFYGSYYLNNLLMLCLYLIPAVLIGVSARKHLLNINALFDKKLTETDLLIGEKVNMDEAHFRLSTIVKALTNSQEYRDTFIERAASFELKYPILVRRGFLALIVIPLVLLLLLFIVPAKLPILALWIVSLVVICTFLIVIEYFHDRVVRKTSLSNLSKEELYNLLSDSLRQEVLAFAPLEVMLSKKTAVLGKLHKLDEPPADDTKLDEPPADDTKLDEPPTDDAKGGDDHE